MIYQPINHKDLITQRTRKISMSLHTVHLKETKRRTKTAFMLHKGRQPFQEAAVYKLSNTCCQKNQNSDELGSSLSQGCKLDFLKRNMKRLLKIVLLEIIGWRVIVEDQPKLMQTVA